MVGTNREKERERNTCYRGTNGERDEEGEGVY